MKGTRGGEKQKKAKVQLAHFTGTVSEAAHGMIFPVGCYQSATGTFQPQCIKQDLDYSRSLFFCSDTSS